MSKKASWSGPGSLCRSSRKRSARTWPARPAGRLVRFLVGIYCGRDYPFDLTDLRALGTELVNACADSLSYGRRGKREVHHPLAGGNRELQEWLRDY